MLKTTNTFAVRKAKILSELAQPDEVYIDASPKGSVDVQVRELVSKINLLPSCVTTSSCSGRISVYVDGSKSSTDESGDAVYSGGKGAGGHWLFTSHDPVGIPEDVASMLGVSESALEGSICPSATQRLIHLKFEPLIIHILTESLEASHRVVSAAVQAGFRESGVTSITSECPMVAVRTNGLSLESIIGSIDENGDPKLIVSRNYLVLLLNVCNQRFKMNEERKLRLTMHLEKEFTTKPVTEDKRQRWQRKREEGLQRQLESNSKVRHVRAGGMDSPLNVNNLETFGDI